MRQLRPRFTVRRLMILVAVPAIVLGCALDIKRRSDARYAAFLRFKSWSQRADRSATVPSLGAIKYPSRSMIPFVAGEGSIRLVTPSWRAILVTPKIDLDGRIDRVTIEAAGRLVEASGGDVEGGRPFDYRRAVPEAFR